jgi:hypothetical protein
MRFDFGHFRTKLGARIVMWFVLCALLPTVALSFVSYRTVRTELIRQSIEQMELGTTDAQMGVLEGLQSVESELILWTASPNVGRALSGAEAGPGGAQTLRRLNALTLVSSNAIVPILGDLTATPKLTPERLTDLEAGESALVVAPV